MATDLEIRAGVGSAARGDRVVLMGALLDALTRGGDPVLDAAAFRELPTLPELRYWLIQEVEALLDRAARDQPLLVSVDDLQWADSGTMAAVELLSARLASLPIAWVVAMRSEEIPADLRVALRRLEMSGAARLELGPLDDAAVAEVIADLVGAEPDQSLLDLAGAARGAPFWLTELLLGLREEGLLEMRGARAGVREARLPARMRDTMRERLERMSPAARDAATVAAALGNRFTFGAVVEMLGAAPASLLDPLNELQRADLLVEEGDGLAFRHDILREAVLDSLPPSARRTLERRAASVLLKTGALPVEVAEQLAASAQPGDTEAIEILIGAVKSLGGSDPSAAAELAQRTLEITPRSDPRRGSLVAEVAILLHAAGRLEQATAFADTALGNLLPPDQESEVRFGIAGMFSLSADVRAEAGRRALALPGLSPAARGRHKARLVHNVLAGGRRTEAQRLVADAEYEIIEHGDQATVFSLGLAMGGLRYEEGNFAESLERIEAAVRAGSVEGEDARARIARQWRTEVLAATDRFDEAVPLAIAGLESARAESQAWAIQLWEQWRGRQHFQLGEFADAVAALEGMFRPEEAHSTFGSNDASAISALSASALHLGERQLITRCAEFATVMLERGTPELRRHSAWILAQQAAAAGEPARARDVLAGLAEELPANEPLLPYFPVDVTDEPHLVRIALAAGDPLLAEQAAALATDRAQRNPLVHSVVGAAAQARGLLAADHEELLAAVEHFEQSPRRPALASALEDAGALAARNGARTEAIALLGRALELTAEMGATWDATRIRHRLRELGVRRRLTTIERPSTGWSALTPSELAVVGAITGGMTNREAATDLFLSPHTVSSHLRRVFEKLHISSRVQLARIATENAGGG